MPVYIEPFLEEIRLTDDGRLSWQSGELTDENIAYIREWTDCETAREVTEEVLSGHYKARQKAAE
jgi:hypothetical protein